MITIWRYYLSAAMITRWHYYINAVLITRWRYFRNTVIITRWQYCTSVEWSLDGVHWIVNMSNCKELWIARRKHQHLQNRMERLLIRKTGYRKIERQMGRKREKEGGRMQCVMKKEDKILIDVENVEATGGWCCHLS